MAFYKGALTTKKSAIVAAVLEDFPARTNKVMATIDCTTSPVKPLSGTGPGRSRLGLIPILMKASQNRISIELSFSTRIRRIVKFDTCIVTTNALLCG